MPRAVSVSFLLGLAASFSGVLLASGLRKQLGEGAMAAKQKELQITVPDLVIPDVADPAPLLTPRSPGQSGRRECLTKQLSQKANCLCSPTTHVGSFRCRHHRSSNLIRSSASVGSGLSEYGNASGSLRSRQSLRLSELGGNSRSLGSQLSALDDEATAGDTSVRV